jgi:putative ABC transport system substrate-binding protein
MIDATADVHCRAWQCGGVAAYGAGTAASDAGDWYSQLWTYGETSELSGPEFFQGLSEMGYVEGRNVAIEFRGAEQYDQLLALAADLVRRKVAVIYAAGTANSAMAAKAATTTFPIVFGNGSDAIRVGLVPSLSRPDGNITGVTYFISEVVTQRLQYLRELVPGAAVGTIGFLTNPTNLLSKPDTSDVLAAAQRIGQQIKRAGSGNLNRAISGVSA